MFCFRIWVYWKTVRFDGQIGVRISSLTKTVTTVAWADSFSNHAMYYNTNASHTIIIMHLGNFPRWQAWGQILETLPCQSISSLCALSWMLVSVVAPSIKSFIITIVLSALNLSRAFSLIHGSNTMSLFAFVLVRQLVAAFADNTL